MLVSPFRFALVALVGAVSFPVLDAEAATYKVGPNETMKDLSEVEELLEPGDVVEVAGDATYPGNIHIRQESAGTPEQKVTIRGMRVNGKRPHLQGGDEFTIVLNADHIVFEGFEVTGGGHYCVVHKGNDVTIRDVVVHDCPDHGILGTDSESGDLLMEFIEVYNCGGGDNRHQIYIATDEQMFPGSTFRLQHSFVHDQNGGNSVKSRAERNEIYSNWLESHGDGYHILDLIGPDGEPTDTAREDSDVVGNVLVQRGRWTIARMGGDGTAETNGRYRFAFNTIIGGSDIETFFRARDGIESLEISNNVFFLPEGGSPIVLHDDEASWVGGSLAAAGTNNYMHSAISPASFLTGTMVGDDPGFENPVGNDYRIKESSGLVDKGLSAGMSPDGLQIPEPGMPQWVPPAYQVDASLTPVPRQLVGELDVGAFEFGTGTIPGMTTNSTSSGNDGDGDGDGSGGADGGGGADDGCSCRQAGDASSSEHAWMGFAVLVGLAWRRVRRAA